MTYFRWWRHPATLLSGDSSRTFVRSLIPYNARVSIQPTAEVNFLSGKSCLSAGNFQFLYHRRFEVGVSCWWGKLSVSRSAARSSCRRIWRAIGPAVRAVDAQRDANWPPSTFGLTRPFTASALRYSGAARGVPMLGYPLVEVRCSGMCPWGSGFALAGAGFGMRPGLQIRYPLAEFRYPPWWF